MNLLSMLNVVLAMAGIYLLLSLVASGINERIASILGARAATLRMGLKAMLGPVLAEKFGEHALRASLTQPQGWVERATRKVFRSPFLGKFGKGVLERLPWGPSYVRPETVAQVVLDLVRTETGRSPVAVARGGIQASGDRKDPPVAEGLQLVLEQGLRAAERAGVKADTEVLAHIEAALATQFDATMERATGWYRRRTQVWLVVISAILTMGLNLDSLALAGALWADPQLSTDLSAAAASFVHASEGEQGAGREEAKEQPDAGGAAAPAGESGAAPAAAPDTGSTDAAKGEADAAMPTTAQVWEQLRAARVETLPMGWDQPDVPVCPESKASGSDASSQVSGEGCGAWGPYLWRHVWGWLISVFAIAAGAPFWFDMIAKITNLRAAGGLPGSSTPAPAPAAGVGEASGSKAPPTAPPAGPGATPLAGLPEVLRTGPSRRRALLAAEAAELAYESDEEARTKRAAALGLSALKVVESAKTGTAVLCGVLRDGTRIVAFRGTEPTQLKDAKTDLSATLKLAEDGAEGREHAGFAAALASVEAALDDWCAQQGGGPLLVCGHSLGGALACLYARARAVAAARAGGPVADLELVTFGCPRVGDADHAAALNRLVPRHLRFVHDDDVVTRVPLRTMGYRHAGTVLFFDGSGLLGATPAGWVQFLNRAVAASENLQNALAKGVKDHSMARYLRLVTNTLDGEAESSPGES